MARDWKIGEVVYLKSGSPAMTVTIESANHDGSTTVSWYSDNPPTGYPAMQTASFHKDCLTSEEPTHNLDVRLERARVAQASAPVYHLSSSEKPATVKVELPPITVNSTVEQPISLERSLQRVLDAANEKIPLRLIDMMVDVHRLLEQTFDREIRLDREMRTSKQVTTPLAASLETLQQMETERTTQATITAHPMSGTGQAHGQIQTSPTEPRRKK